MKTPFICALCNKSIPEIITSHSNGIKKWSQDIMPSESDGEDRCHRELPSSEEPQESFSTSDCEDPQSSDCEDPQSDPAPFSFSFALDRLHTSMRESALLTSLERTSGCSTASSTMVMSKVRSMPVTRPASEPASFSPRGYTCSPTS